MSEVKVCPQCDGKGWYEDSESDHAPNCDCDTENTTCPIEVQVQVECSLCDSKSTGAPS